MSGQTLNGKRYLGDNICHHGDCTCNEPSRLVLRKLRGVDWRETYCREHDPLDDPQVREFWETV